MEDEQQRCRGRRLSRCRMPCPPLHPATLPRLSLSPGLHLLAVAVREQRSLRRGQRQRRKSGTLPDSEPLEMLFKRKNKCTLSAMKSEPAWLRGQRLSRCSIRWQGWRTSVVQLPGWCCSLMRAEAMGQRGVALRVRCAVAAARSNADCAGRRGRRSMRVSSRDLHLPCAVINAAAPACAQDEQLLARKEEGDHSAPSALTPQRLRPTPSPSALPQARHRCHHSERPGDSARQHSTSSSPPTVPAHACVVVLVTTKEMMHRRSLARESSLGRCGSG